MTVYTVMPIHILQLSGKYRDRVCLTLCVSIR